MRHIFEGNWVYLAHESQLPEPGGYFTTYVGRQPVVITRDTAGELHCLQCLCTPRRGAGYPPSFDVDGSHDLTKVARFESYRGFLLGSLSTGPRTRPAT